MGSTSQTKIIRKLAREGEEAIAAAVADKKITAEEAKAARALTTAGKENAADDAKMKATTARNKAAAEAPATPPTEPVEDLLPGQAALRSVVGDAKAKQSAYDADPTKRYVPYQSGDDLKAAEVSPGEVKMAPLEVDGTGPDRVVKAQRAAKGMPIEAVKDEFVLPEESFGEKFKGFFGAGREVSPENKAAAVAAVEKAIGREATAPERALIEARLGRSEPIPLDEAGLEKALGIKKGMSTTTKVVGTGAALTAAGMAANSMKPGEQGPPAPPADTPPADPDKEPDPVDPDRGASISAAADRRDDELARIIKDAGDVRLVPIPQDLQDPEVKSNTLKEFNTKMRVRDPRTGELLKGPDGTDGWTPLEAMQKYNEMRAEELYQRGEEYRREKNAARAGALWAEIIRGVAALAAGAYGVKHGVDMSGAKFSPIDWIARQNAERAGYETDVMTTDKKYAALSEVAQANQTSDKEKYQLHLQWVEAVRAKNTDTINRIQAHNQQILAKHNLKFDAVRIWQDQAQHRDQVKLKLLELKKLDAKAATDLEKLQDDIDEAFIKAQDAQADGKPGLAAGYLQRAYRKSSKLQSELQQRGLKVDLTNKDTWQTKGDNGEGLFNVADDPEFKSPEEIQGRMPQYQAPYMDGGSDAPDGSAGAETKKIGDKTYRKVPGGWELVP